MAFVVEDGSIVDNANSYATVAEANAYATDIGNEDWTDLEDSEKETALVRSTYYFDSSYRTRWKGVKMNRYQALSFPRDGVVDEDGYLLGNNLVPDRLKRAVIDLALVVGADSTVDLFAIDQDLAGVRRKKEKVDVLEVETEYFGSGDQALGEFVRARFQSAKVWLQGLVTSSLSGRVERG